MSKYEPIAVGKVESLIVNGGLMRRFIHFSLEGPSIDQHAGMARRLSGHDGGYLRTSSLKRGYTVFNWRSWTALSLEELEDIQHDLNVRIPQGCLQENFILSGIPKFSKLPPTSRLVFPNKSDKYPGAPQAILAVWEENGPCRTVGDRLAKHHKRHELSARFVEVAKGRRGLMGFVLSAGYVHLNDEVLVYPPVTE